MKPKIMEGMRKCLQGKLNGGTRGRKIDMRGGEAWRGGGRKK